MTFIALTPWRRRVGTTVHPENDLYTIDPHYPEAVEATGAMAAILPWVVDPATATERMRRVDALVVSGGADVDPACYGAEPAGAVGWDRRADTSDAALIRAAVALGKPVLAICRGLQIANVAFGGTLHQHITGCSEHHRPRNPTDGSAAAKTAAADEHLARRHRVDLVPGSTIASIFGAAAIEVNSLHHQSADRLGTGLRITGQAPDGIVEALEHDSGLIVAVQWHPERVTDEGHQVLFDWLAERAGS